MNLRNIIFIFTALFSLVNLFALDIILIDGNEMRGEILKSSKDEIYLIHLDNPEILIIFSKNEIHKVFDSGVDITEDILRTKIKKFINFNKYKKIVRYDKNNFEIDRGFNKETVNESQNKKFHFSIKPSIEFGAIIFDEKLLNGIGYQITSRSSYGSKTGLSLSFEIFHDLRNNFSIGLGAAYQLSRTINTNYKLGRDGFYFIPVYGLINTNISSTNEKLNIIGQIGICKMLGNLCKNFEIEEQRIALNPSLYLGAGLGYIFKELTIEVLYKRYQTYAYEHISYIDESFRYNIRYYLLCFINCNRILYLKSRHFKNACFFI